MENRSKNGGGYLRILQEVEWKWREKSAYMNKREKQRRTLMVAIIEDPGHVTNLSCSDLFCSREINKHEWANISDSIREHAVVSANLHFSSFIRDLPFKVLAFHSTFPPFLSPLFRIHHFPPY